MKKSPSLYRWRRFIQSIRASRLAAGTLAAAVLFSIILTGCGSDVDAESASIENPTEAAVPTSSDSRVEEPATSEVERTDFPVATAVPAVGTPTTTTVPNTPQPTMPQQGTAQLENDPTEAPDGSAAAAAAIKFRKEYVDTNYGGIGTPGWVRSGDMDRDGDVDIVAGGGRALFIYENNGNAGGWRRYGNLDGSDAIGANGAVLFDVDGDSDLDVVSAHYYGSLGWWKNPGGKLANQPWQFYPFSSESWFLHDLDVVDLDQDGQAEEFIANLNSAYWDSDLKIKWFRPGSNTEQPWEAHTIESGRYQGAAHGHAGMDAGDIDKDGHIDIAYSNGWYEAPDDPSGKWSWRQVTDIYGISNALLEDMDGDLDLDVLVSGGHHGQGVFWFENSGNPKSGKWTQHNVSAVSGDVTQRHYFDPNFPDHLHHPECLAAADLDSDGDLDVVTCDLFFGEDAGEPGWNEEAHTIYVFENSGDSLAWEKYGIAPKSYPSHLLQLADVNQDGRPDIISEGAGYSIVSYYQNTTIIDSTPPPSTPAPTPTQTATSRVTQTPPSAGFDNPIFVPVASSG